ncbi:MAG: hypothetical protein U0821_06265 [Chloroflexota bacterium]
MPIAIQVGHGQAVVLTDRAKRAMHCRDSTRTVAEQHDQPARGAGDHKVRMRILIHVAQRDGGGTGDSREKRRRTESADPIAEQDRNRSGRCARRHRVDSAVLICVAERNEVRGVNQRKRLAHPKNGRRALDR